MQTTKCHMDVKEVAGKRITRQVLSSSVQIVYSYLFFHAVYAKNMYDYNN